MSFFHLHLFITSIFFYELKNDFTRIVCFIYYILIHLLQNYHLGFVSFPRQFLHYKKNNFQFNYFQLIEFLKIYVFEVGEYFYTILR